MKRFDREGMDHINGLYCNYADVKELQEDLKEAYESMIDIEHQFNDEFIDNIKLKYNKLLTL
jgi:hypothetical protein